MTSKAQILRDILARDGCQVMPCCGDPLTAKMIEQAGFPVSFMSGFSAAALRLGVPDLGLMSYAESVDQGRNICAAVSIPMIGDGDTGYGNALNVKRTVRGFAQAGFAAIMIEDQLAPKRCGHTRGKLVVTRDEAVQRIRAAVDARDELRRDGSDILILARTDARATDGLDEAVWRANSFSDAGADFLFVEAPNSEAELAEITARAPGIHMANMIEGGATPLLSHDRLAALGYSLAAYPLTLLAVAMRAMSDALVQMSQAAQGGGGQSASATMPAAMSFAELRKVIGFDAYHDDELRYASAALRAERD